MAAVFIYTQLWAGRRFALVTFGVVRVAVFLFVNIIFVLVVIGFVWVAVFVFVAVVGTVRNFQVLNWHQVLRYIQSS